MQDRIIIDFNALNRISSKLRKASQEMDDAMDSLSGLYPTKAAGADLQLYDCGCTLSTIHAGVSATNVSSAISNYRSAIRRLSDYSDSLAAAVNDLADDYRKMEKSIAGDVGVLPQNTEDAASDEGGSSFDWTGIFNWNNLLKIISSFGVVGPVISTIGQWITGGLSTSSVLKMLGYGTKAIGAFAKNVKNNSFDWSKFDWLGLMPKDKMTYGEAFQKQLDSLDFGQATSTSGKIAVAAKWAGHIITVVTEGIENIAVNEEGNSLGRAIAETAGESAVKIVGGIALTAALTAVGAPAVVAGVVVGAVWIVGDAITEHLIGKDMAEAASDLILDTASAAIDIGKDIAKDIGSAARQAGKAISGWWSSFADKPLFA